MIQSMASASNALYDTLSEASGIIEAIAAIVNLVIVIFFFVWEKRDNFKREKARVKEENYLDWYRLLVVERLIKDIDAFFEDVTRQIMDVAQKHTGCDPIDQTIYLSDIIDKVKSDFSQKKRILIPTLDLFSSDLKKKVWSLFQENMDQVLDEIEKMIVGSGSSDRALGLLSETKVHIYKELYEFDLKRLNEISLDQ